MIKKAASIVAVLFGVGALSFIAAPLVMSSDRVKARIEAQLSDVTGRPVRLSGDSSLSLFPYLGVTYSNVSMGGATGTDDALVQIDEMRAQLGVFSVLWGDARLSKVTLVRPRLSLSRDATGRPNWLPVSGRLQALLDKDTLEGAEPFPIGRLTVTDGIITFTNKQAQDDAAVVSELTSVNGTMTWPELAASADVAFTGVWRGEVVQVTAEADTPFNLLTGQKSEVTVAIDSNPMKLTYTGTADGEKVSILQGALSVETPSLRRLAGWLNRTEDIAEKLGQLSLSGQLLKQADSVELTDTTVLIDGDTGTGRLQLVDQPDRNLEISGTLAFDSLTLPAWSAFFRSNSDPTAAGTMRQLDFGFLNTINLDLRLSAQNASSNGLSIQNLAATVLVRDGNASMDIGSADALDGVFSGVFGVVPGTPNQFNLDANFQQVSLPALTALVGQNSVALRGVGNARFRFKSEASESGEFLKKLRGEGTLTALSGVVEGVDLARAIGEEASTQATIFAGSTPYDALQIGFLVSDGIVYLRDTNLKNTNFTATLNGKADLVRRSIALRGTVNEGSSSQDDGQAGDAHPFFVGGVTDAPLYAPLPKRVVAKPNVPNTNEDAAPSQ
ncbi:MAG: AsmA family protein [Pseudomonadota bacterium]